MCLFVSSVHTSLHLFNLWRQAQPQRKHIRSAHKRVHRARVWSTWQWLAAGGGWEKEWERKWALSHLQASRGLEFDSCPGKGAFVPSPPASLAVRVRLQNQVLPLVFWTDIAHRRHLSMLFLLSDTQLHLDERQRVDRIKFREYPAATGGCTQTHTHTFFVCKWAKDAQARQSRIRLHQSTSECSRTPRSSSQIIIQPTPCLSNAQCSLYHSCCLCCHFCCFVLVLCACICVEGKLGGEKAEKVSFGVTFSLGDWQMRDDESKSQRAIDFKGSCVPAFIGNNAQQPLSQCGFFKMGREKATRNRGRWQRRYHPNS